MRRKIFVQMSHEWIAKNLVGAVGKSIAIDAGKKLTSNQKNYSRHLFYVAIWTESAQEHAKAVLNGTTEDGSTHASHALKPQLHNHENDVKTAVNQRKEALRKKYRKPTLVAGRSMIPFHERRRQQFITENYFSEISSLTKGWIGDMQSNLGRPELRRREPLT